MSTISELHDLVTKKTHDTLKIQEWRYVKSIQDVLVHTADGDIMLVKGVGVVQKSMEEVTKFIVTNDITLRKKWDLLCNTIKIMQEGDDWRIAHMYFDSPSIFVTKRNFLLFQRVWTENDIVYVANMSVPEDHEFYIKEEEGQVRGFCHSQSS
jgi:hypothetical protein